MFSLLLTLIAQSPAAVAGTEQAAAPPVAPLIAELPDGRRLAFQCSGTGTPTVIFDSGLGAGALVWSRVQPKIARTTRACAFDRPGYGASDEGPMPRDAVHIAGDLKAGLDAVGLAGPYVLVGHSMGGYNTRLFANLHRDDVVGMVLVDPSIDGNEAPLRAVSPAFVQAMADFAATAGRCIRATAEGRMRADDPIHAECGAPPPDSPMANAGLARTALSEQQSLDASSRQVLDSGPVSRTLPLIVLTAGAQYGPETGTPTPERAALLAVITENHAAIAAQSAVGAHRLVDDAPHMIPMARPDVVAIAILDVISQIETRPQP